MKTLLIATISLCFVFCVAAQEYPQPEFTREIYLLKKDSGHSLVRLEKGSAGMETKTKAGGFGGFESGYALDNEKSTTRLVSGKNLSFIYTSGSGEAANNAIRDSVMRAHGLDPSMATTSGSADDPGRITLYKMDVNKGKRNIYLQKGGGAFSAKKLQSSDKYTFSLKTIRKGYWELVIDKPLPKGEYAFSMMDAGMNNMDGSVLLFCFGID